MSKMMSCKMSFATQDIILNDFMRALSTVNHLHFPYRVPSIFTNYLKLNSFNALIAS